jgi:hypothetical protein
LFIAGILFVYPVTLHQIIIPTMEGLTAAQYRLRTDAALDLHVAETTVETVLDATAGARAAIKTAAEVAATVQDLAQDALLHPAKIAMDINRREAGRQNGRKKTLTKSPHPLRLHSPQS